MPEVLRGGIAINEVLVDPNSASASFDTDGSGRATGADEFLELVNLSSSAIDISGLELWDAQRGNWFTFPPGSVLQPGAHAIVVRNVQNGGALPATGADDLAFDADFGNGVFNNGRDNLVVLDHDAGEFVQAIYNGDAIDDPPNDYGGFPSSATRVGAVEDFGSDMDGFSIQRNGTGFANDGILTPGAQNVCFVSGTRILTPEAFRAIDQLRPGDWVMTRDAGPKRVQWLFARHVSTSDLHADPRLRPIVVAGHGSARPLRVSRQHRIALGGPIVARMFDAAAILAPAKDLLGAPGVSVDTTDRPFYYWHLLLDGHHIINAEGVAAESLFIGPQAEAALSPEALAELGILFPGGLPMALQDVRASPHRLERGSKVRHMALRHRKNAQPLSATY